MNKGTIRSSLLLLISLLILFGLLVIGCGGGGGGIDPGPPVPMNMIAVAGNSAVQLTWDSGGASANRTGYRIYRGDQANGPWTLVQEVGEVNTWTDHGVINGEDYWYRLSAVSLVDGQVHEGTQTAAFPAGGVTPSPTLPVTPMNLIAVAGNHQVTLQWDPVTDATVVGYKVFRGLTPDGLSYHASILNPSATSFLDGQLMNGTTYYYYVETFDASNEDSLPSNTVSATPNDNEAPAPPENFRGAPGNTRNMLMWDPSESTDVVSYTIYQETYTTVLTTVPSGATNYVHYPVVNDASYDYWIDAVDEDGNHSSIVGPVSLVPNDNVAPFPPVDVVAEDQGEQVKLTWQEPPAQVTDIAGFRIARSMDANGPFEDNEDIDDPVIVNLTEAWIYIDDDDDLEVYQNYWYLIRTVDKQGNLSQLNASAAVGVSLGAPLPPNNVTGVAGDNSVTINWENNTNNANALDLDGFEIWRSNNDDVFALITTVGPEAVSYTDIGVVNYLTYDYYIKAVDSWDFTSQPSNVVEDMRPTDAAGPNPPQNFNAYDTLKDGGAGELRVNLSWTAPEGEYDVDHYEILFSDDGIGDANTWLVIGTTSGPETSFIDYRPMEFEGLSVWYAVRAIDLAERTSQVSNVDVVVPGSPLAPNLEWPGIDCNALQFVWTMPANAGLTDLDGFTLLRSDSEEGEYHSVDAGIAKNARSFIDSTVENGIQYWYYLECSDEVGNVSAPSAVVYGQARCTDIPMPPTGLTATDTLDGVVNVLLNWTPSTDADVDGQIIYRRQNGREEDVVATVGRDIGEFIDNDTTGLGLDENETYYYIVRAYRDVVDDELPGNPTVRYESENSVWAAVTPGRPDAPANLVAIGSDHQVSLSWSPVNEEPFNRSDDAVGDPTSERSDDIKQYEVWRSDDGINYYFLAASGDTAYIDQTVNNEVMYYYWLRTRDMTGHVSPQIGPDFEINPFLIPPDLVADNYVSVIPTDGYPLPVGGVEVVEVLTARLAGAEDGAILSWLPSDDEDLAGYNIYRGESEFGPWSQIAMLWGPTTFTDMNFVPNPNDIYRRWYWYVAAVDDNGNESLEPNPLDPLSSAVVSCTPGEPDSPLTFTGFAGNGQISLAWDPSAVTADDVVGFKLYRYEGISFTPPDPNPNDPQDPDNYMFLTAINDPFASNWIDDDGVINNKPYWYALTSFDAVGNETLEEDWTLTSMIVPNDSVPNPPTGLTAVEVYNTITGDIEVHLSWNPNNEDDIDHYNVHVRDSADPIAGFPPYNLLVADAGFATVYIDVPANDGDYTYVVTAVDDETPVPNESGPSNDARVLVGAPANPTGLSVTGLDSEVTLNWDYNFTVGWDTVGFNVYRLEVDETAGDGPEGLVAELGITDSFTDTDVLNEHWYRYRVTAIDGAGLESVAMAANTEEGGPTDMAPDNPANVQVIEDFENGSHYFRITWDQNNEIDLEGYRVYRRIVGASWPSTPIAEIGYEFTSYDDDSGVTNNVFYEYGVTAFDTQWHSPVDGWESGMSPASNAVERYAPLAPTWAAPPGTPGDTVITLSWLANQEPDLDSYRLFRGVTMNDLYFLVDVPGDQESYLDHDLDNGTAYWYGITAVDIFGNESPMTVIETPIIPQDGPPVAPDNVEIYNDAAGVFYIDWDNNFEPDVIGYNVYRNGAGPELLRYADSEGSALVDDGSLVFGGIVADTAYYYEVRAVDTDSLGADREGPGTTSNGAEIGAPGIPGGLGAVQVGDEFVEFSWTAVSTVTYPDFAGYKVYRNDTPPGGVFAFIADVGDVTSYTDYGLVNEHDYAYAITSYDIFGNESGLSLALNLTPTDGAPLPPYNVEITEDDGTLFRVEWDPSESDDAADYAVRRLANGVVEPGGQVTMGGAVYLYNDVFPGQWGFPGVGTSITYQVATIDEGGNQGDWSHIDNSNCAERNRPPALAGVAALSGDEVVQISWPASTVCDLAGYNVYRDGSFLAYADAPVLTYNDTDVVNGVDYSYTVRPIDVFGNEALDSNAVVGSPNDGAPLPVDNCEVTQDTAAGFRIEWDPNPEHDIAGYRVTRQPGATAIGGLITDNYVIDATALDNTAYTYEVVAEDEDGMTSTDVCETLGVESRVPAAPTSINVTNGDGYSSVSFGGPSLATYPDVVGYNIYLESPALSGNIAFVDYVEYNAAGNSYLFENLINEGSYYTHIHAVDRFGLESSGSVGNYLVPTNGHPVVPDYCEIYADNTDGVSLQWIAPNNDTPISQYVIRRWHWDDDTSTWIEDVVVATGNNWYETGSSNSTFTDNGGIFEGLPGSGFTGWMQESNYRYQIAADDNADPAGVTRFDDMNYCWTTNCVERGAPMALVSADYDWNSTLPGGLTLDNRIYWAEPGIDPDDAGDVAYIHWIYDVDFGGPNPSTWSPYTSDDDTAGDDDDNYSVPCDCGGWKVFITLQDPDYIDRTWQLLEDIPNCEIRQVIDHAVLTGGTYCYAVAMYDQFGNVELPVDGPIGSGGTVGYCIDIEDNPPSVVFDLFISIAEGPNNDIVDLSGADNGLDPTTDFDMNLGYSNADPRNTNGDQWTNAGFRCLLTWDRAPEADVTGYELWFSDALTFDGTFDTVGELQFGGTIPQPPAGVQPYVEVSGAPFADGFNWLFAVRAVDEFPGEPGGGGPQYGPFSNIENWEPSNPGNGFHSGIVNEGGNVVVAEVLNGVVNAYDADPNDYVPRVDITITEPDVVGDGDFYPIDMTESGLGLLGGFFGDADGDGDNAEEGLVPPPAGQPQGDLMPKNASPMDLLTPVGGYHIWRGQQYSWQDPLHEGVIGSGDPDEIEWETGAQDGLMRNLDSIATVFIVNRYGDAGIEFVGQGYNGTSNQQNNPLHNDSTELGGAWTGWALIGTIPVNAPGWVDAGSPGLLPGSGDQYTYEDFGQQYLYPTTAANIDGYLQIPSTYVWTVSMFDRFGNNTGNQGIHQDNATALTPGPPDNLERHFAYAHEGFRWTDQIRLNGDLKTDYAYLVDIPFRNFSDDTGGPSLHLHGVTGVGTFNGSSEFDISHIDFESLTPSPLDGVDEPKALDLVTSQVGSFDVILRMPVTDDVEGGPYLPGEIFDWLDAGNPFPYGAGGAIQPGYTPVWDTPGGPYNILPDGFDPVGGDAMGDIEFHWISATPLASLGNRWSTGPLSIADPSTYGATSTMRVPFATSGEPAEFIGVAYNGGGLNQPAPGDEAFLEVRFFDSDGFCSISCVYKEDEDTFLSGGFDVL